MSVYNLIITYYIAQGMKYLKCLIITDTAKVNFIINYTQRTFMVLFLKQKSKLKLTSNKHCNVIQIL